jgi:hypothetical protein
MKHFDYKAVPAPRRCKKAKGVREPAELFALTLTDAINEQAREGWEYVRAETLPAETPRGFFRRAAEEDVTMLLFRRERASREPLVEAPPPAAVQPIPEARPASPPQTRSEPGFSGPGFSGSGFSGPGRSLEDRVQAASLARREPRISQGREDNAEIASPLRPAPRINPVEPS